MTTHGVDATLRRIRRAGAAVVLIAAVEVAGAIASGSLSLLSDAGHLVTDSATLGLTWYAMSRTRRPAGARHTFGHLRSGILAAAVNGAALTVISAAIAAGAVARLQHPAHVAPVPVIVIGLVALGGNAAIARSLGSAGGGLGVRSVTLHVLADAATDAAVVAGAVLMLAFGWTRADAIVSLAIAALILAGAVSLLREVVHILDEGTPGDVDPEALRRRITAIAGIEDAHDLHVWSLDREHRAMSVHVTVGDRPLAEVTAMIREVETVLCEEFGIEHATVQPECPACSDTMPLYCDLDERHALVHRGAAVGDLAHH